MAVIAACVASACTARDTKTGDSTTRPTAAQSVVTGDTDDFGMVYPDSTKGRRVVSLVPAATEIIFAVGRGDRLVGRTSWDNFPDSAKLVPNVGDGIRPSVEVVLATKPTLVVIYATAENRAAATAFKDAGIAVCAIKVDRIEDFERLTMQLGKALNAESRARQVVDTVKRTLEKVRATVAGARRPTVVWPVWDSPIMVVGSGSFLAELLDISGADNVFADLKQPSPQVTIEELAKRDPTYIMTSARNFAILSGNAKWLALKAIREKKVLSPDTTYVGRPTVTLGMAAVSLAKLLHPDLAARLP